MTSESTRDLGEAATIVAEWLNSDDLGHTLLIESIARALRAARSSSTGWVPTSARLPDTNRDVLFVMYGNTHCYGHWSERERAWFDRSDSSYDGPDRCRAEDVTHWAELPALPRDGETGGGRG